MNINEWSKRDSCVICGSAKFEPLFAFPDFPGFLGSAENPAEDDLRGDLQFDICTDCGCAQCRELAPLNLLYGKPHADAPGVIWDNHVKQYGAFIRKYSGEKIFEVGGGNGKLADEVLGGKKSIRSWQILEPNTQRNDFADNRISSVEGWFTPEYRTPTAVDTFVFSHVVEHFYDPAVALRTVAENLPCGGVLLFSFPDMKATINEGQLNVLHFEHTYYADEALLDYLTCSQGFEKIASEHYAGHSIFFAFRKSATLKRLPTPNYYKENRDFLRRYMDSVFADAEQTRAKVEGLEEPVYLCPASIFAQFFLRAGFPEKLLTGLIDNSPLKIGKRLYGTNLVTSSPQILRQLPAVTVIMRAGVYNPEIQKQILEQINPRVKFL